jgi:hypothetical protein
MLAVPVSYSGLALSVFTYCSEAAVVRVGRIPQSPTLLTCHAFPS